MMNEPADWANYSDLDLDQSGYRVPFFVGLNVGLQRIVRAVGLLMRVGCSSEENTLCVHTGYVLELAHAWFLC